MFGGNPMPGAGIIPGGIMPGGGMPSKNINNYFLQSIQNYKHF